MDEITKEAYLAHFGIKGQKWGIRRYQNEDGSLTGEGRSHYGVGEKKDWKRLKKDAAEDAKRWAAAKAYYGEGAGNRRKKVKNSISERMKDPDYKAEFEKQLAGQNMEKHQRNANLERHTRDTAEKTRKIVKAAVGITITGLSIAMATNPELRNKVSLAVNKYGSMAISKAKDAFNGAKDAARNATNNLKKTLSGNKKKTLDDFLKNARVVPENKSNTSYDKVMKKVDEIKDMKKSQEGILGLNKNRGVIDTIKEKGVGGALERKLGLNPKAMSAALESNKVKHFAKHIKSIQLEMAEIKDHGLGRASTRERYEQLTKQLEEMSKHYNSAFAQAYENYFKRINA